MLKSADCDTSLNKGLFVPSKRQLIKAVTLHIAPRLGNTKPGNFCLLQVGVHGPNFVKITVERPQSPLVFCMAMSRYGRVPGSSPQALIWN